MKYLGNQPFGELSPRKELEGGCGRATGGVGGVGNRNQKASEYSISIQPNRLKST